MELMRKTVNMKSLIVASVKRDDYPKFCDAYFSTAEFEDGQSLDDEELETLSDVYSGTLNDLAHEVYIDMCAED